MGLMALDLLRILGWGLVNFIYSIIDTLFEILKSLNAFDIISSVSNNNTFFDSFPPLFCVSEKFVIITKTTQKYAFFSTFL